jgi:hypothetical protein
MRARKPFSIHETNKKINKIAEVTGDKSGGLFARAQFGRLKKPRRRKKQT